MLQLSRSNEIQAALPILSRLIRKLRGQRLVPGDSREAWRSLARRPRAIQARALGGAGYAKSCDPPKYLKSNNLREKVWAFAQAFRTAPVTVLGRSAETVVAMDGCGRLCLIDVSEER